MAEKRERTSLQPPSHSLNQGTGLLLLRHAPTGWNYEQRRQGWADQPLTMAARRVARAWADRAPARFDVIVSSDLRRARDTARIIAAAVGLGGVGELEGLREQHQGAWTGLTKEQIRRRWPERLRERPRRPVDGETPDAVLQRVLATLDGIAAAHKGRAVLAVTHSGVIRTLERAIGVDAPPVPPLEGRWLQVAAGACGEPVLRAGPCTAGRRNAAGVGAGASIQELG
jgi:broad specificity phosphatase PhoE